MNYDIEPQKNFEGVILPEMNPIHTGQTIMKFEAPPEYAERLNVLYDEGMVENKFPLNDEQTHIVAGTYLNDDCSPIENHNFIPDDIHEWVKDRIHQYLQVLMWPYYGIKTHVAWINDYGAGEYQPVHMHEGSLTQKEGLVGMLTLKVPENMDRETKNEKPENVRNGFLEFMTGTSRQFAHDQVELLLNPSDFLVFPYDMFHCVYPHFNQNETRRTMPVNVDVFM